MLDEVISSWIMPVVIMIYKYIKRQGFVLYSIEIPFATISIGEKGA
jgi:hypothetical protein